MRKARSQCGARGLNHLVVTNIDSDMTRPADDVAALALSIAQMHKAAIVPQVVSIMIMPRGVVVIIGSHGERIHASGIKALHNQTSAVNSDARCTCIIPYIGRPKILVGTTNKCVDAVFPGSVDADTRGRHIPKATRAITRQLHRPRTYLGILAGVLPTNLVALAAGPEVTPVAVNLSNARSHTSTTIEPVMLAAQLQPSRLHGAISI